MLRALSRTLGVGLSALLPMVGLAATYTVTSTADAGPGSLRQAMLDANGGGADTIVFDIPLTDGGYDAGTGVFTITLNSALPVLTDAGTTIDGTSQRANRGNTNLASGGNPDFPGKRVGTGLDGIVGTADDPMLPDYDGPEIEIDADDRGIIFHIDAANIDLRHLAMFNNPSAQYAVFVSSGTGSVIRECFIGTRADGSDPGAGRHVKHAVELNGGDADVLDNFVAYAEDQALNIRGNTRIEGNDIYNNDLSIPNDDGIAVSTAVSMTVRRNRVDKMPAYAVETYQVPGSYILEDNTFSRCGLGGGDEDGCVRVFGDGNVIRRNVITGATGPGITVNYESSASSGSTNNLISMNSIFGNGEIGIDLDQSSPTSDLTGDGVTLNDGSLSAGGQNQDLDYPVLTSARFSGSDLRLTGYVGTAGSKISGAFTIEAFVADDDGNNAGHGEGRTYVGSCNVVTSVATPDFSCVVSVPPAAGLDVGDLLTTTARLSTNSTSEFSANVVVEHWPAIVKRAYQLDGTPIPDGTVLAQGVRFKFLLYVNNPGGPIDDAAVADLLDPGFTYQPGTLRFDNTLTSSTVCPAGVCDESLIFQRVDGFGTGLGDGDAVTPPTDLDTGSYDAATRRIDVGDGNNSDNARLDIAADSVWALVFLARM